MKKQRVKQEPICDDGRQGIGGKQSSVSRKREAISIRGSIQKACAGTHSSANQAVKTQDVSEEQNMILY